MSLAALRWQLPEEVREASDSWSFLESLNNFWESIKAKVSQAWQSFRSDDSKSQAYLLMSDKVAPGHSESEACILMSSIDRILVTPPSLDRADRTLSIHPHQIETLRAQIQTKAATIDTSKMSKQEFIASMQQAFPTVNPDTITEACSVINIGEGI